MIDNRDAVFRKIRDKKSLMDNETSLHDISLNEEYILDRTDVRVIFITLYSIVFVFCFIGKWSSRSKSIKLPIECQNQFDPYPHRMLWNFPSAYHKKKSRNIV